MQKTSGKNKAPGMVGTEATEERMGTPTAMGTLLQYSTLGLENFRSIEDSAAALATNCVYCKPLAFGLF